MKYEFFEHTADVLFKAYGKNVEEQFSNAALALFSLVYDPLKVKPHLTRKIVVKGKDIQALLYAFLEELLFLLDTEFFLLHEVLSLKIKEDTLTATLTGDVISSRYNVKEGMDIKAVTYHEMKITPSYVQVLLDI